MKAQRRAASKASQTSIHTQRRLQGPPLRLHTSFPHESQWKQNPLERKRPHQRQQTRLCQHKQSMQTYEPLGSKLCSQSTQLHRPGQRTPKHKAAPTTACSPAFGHWQHAVCAAKGAQNQGAGPPVATAAPEPRRLLLTAWKHGQPDLCLSWTQHRCCSLEGCSGSPWQSKEVDHSLGRRTVLSLGSGLLKQQWT